MFGRWSIWLAELWDDDNAQVLRVYRPMFVQGDPVFGVLRAEAACSHRVAVTVARLIATLAPAGARLFAAIRLDGPMSASARGGRLARSALISGPGSNRAGAAWLSTLSAPDVKPDIEPQAAVHPRATTFYYGSSACQRSVRAGITPGCQVPVPKVLT